MAYSYSGAITFGLVFIPIHLKMSVKENAQSFNLIDKKTMSRIKYKKTCVDCENREVKNENIVKGYEYEKDKYVIFTDEDFEKIKSPKDNNIDIIQFVDLKEIDPIYFEKTYYVIPKGSDKAFSVLLKALEKEKKAGIAKTVFGTKDTLILIRAKNGKMLLNTMFFHEEIQEAPEIKKVSVTTKELELASTLINQMTGKFEPEKFKDEYYQKLQKAIKTKVAGKKIVSINKKETPIKVINIMDALKKSIKTTKKTKTLTKKSAKG